MPPLWNEPGLSRDDVATLSRWLESQGLQIERVARGRNWLSFSGKAVDPDGSAPGTDAAALCEADLDIEWPVAVSHNATIVYVYATSAFIASIYAIDQNLGSLLRLSLLGFASIPLP